MILFIISSRVGVEPVYGGGAPLRPSACCITHIPKPGEEKRNK